MSTSPGKLPTLWRWPPQDPPIFWVTFLTLVSLCVSAWLTYGILAEEQRSFLDQQRPYVIFDGVEVSKVQTPDGLKVLLSPHLVNSGLTPAANVTFKSCQPDLHDNAIDPNLKCVQPDAPIAGTIVGPHQPFAARGYPVSIQDLVSTATQGRGLFVLGEVDYKDVLGGGNYYETRYCRQIILDAPSTINVQSFLASPVPPRLSELSCRRGTWECADASCSSLAVEE